MPIRIRELAARTGTTTRSLRYYEEQGLLPAARSANGYRTSSVVGARPKRRLLSDLSEVL